MAHTIIEEGLCDEKFVTERVKDFEAFRAFMKKFTPEEVAEQCGVAAQLIRAAARLYAKCKPGMCIHGLGMTEHSQGVEGVTCMVNLALLTGNNGNVESQTITAGGTISIDCRARVVPTASTVTFSNPTVQTRLSERRIRIRRTR